MELNKRAMKLGNKHNSVTDQNASQGGQTALCSIALRDRKHNATAAGRTQGHN